MNAPACPVCKHEDQVELWTSARDFEYHTSDSKYDYFRCSSCDTIFIHPFPQDQLPLIYPRNYYSFVDQKKTVVRSIKEWADRQHFKKIFRELKTAEINVLDIGGGTGWLCSLLRSMEPRIVVTQIVDIDRNAGIEAQRNGHGYFCGPIEEYQTSEKFDLILMLNLIEHVADPKSVLKHAKHLLSDRGLIYLKTPDIRSFDASLFRKSYWGGLHCPRHWVLFSESSFRKMLKASELEISRVSHTQGGAFWAFSLIVAGHRKGWLQVSRERPVIFHPLFPLLGAIGAGFDILRSPFSVTSQMFILMKHTER